MGFYHFFYTNVWSFVWIISTRRILQNEIAGNLLIRKNFKHATSIPMPFGCIYIQCPLKARRQFLKLTIYRYLRPELNAYTQKCGLNRYLLLAKVIQHRHFLQMYIYSVPDILVDTVYLLEWVRPTGISNSTAFRCIVVLFVNLTRNVLSFRSRHLLI